MRPLRKSGRLLLHSHQITSDVRSAESACIAYNDLKPCTGRVCRTRMRTVRYGTGSHLIRLQLIVKVFFNLPRSVSDRAVDALGDAVFEKFFSICNATNGTFVVKTATI